MDRRRLHPGPRHIVLTAGSLADRFGRRKLFAIGLSIFTAGLGRLRRGEPTSRCSNVARAVQGVGAAVMFAVSLALLAHAFPGEQRARRRPGRLRRDHRRRVRHRPARRRRADQRPRLALGLPHQHPDRHRVPGDHRAARAESRDPRAAAVDWPGQATLTVGPVPAGARAAARQRGRLGQHARSSPSWARAAVLLVALRRHRGARPRADAAAGPVPQRRRSPARRWRRSPSRRRSSRCSSTPRCTCSRSSGCRPSRPASSTCRARLIMFVVSGATAQLVERGAPAACSSRAASRWSPPAWRWMTAAGADSSWTAILPGLMLAMIGTGLFNPAVSAVALGSVPAEQSGLAAGVNDTFRQAGIAVGVAALGALIPAEAALGGGRPGRVRRRPARRAAGRRRAGRRRRRRHGLPHPQPRHGHRARRRGGSGGCLERPCSGAGRGGLWRTAPPARPRRGRRGSAATPTS